MDKAGNEGLTLGQIIFVIIIVLAIVGMIVGIVFTLKGRTEDKFDEVLDTVDRADLAQYASYDNQEVSGSSIEQLYTTVKSSDFIIAVVPASTGASFDPTNLGAINSAYCYNLLPEGNSNNTSCKIDYVDGQYVVPSGYDSVGASKFNYNLYGLSKKGNDEYIKPNSSFFASYIYAEDTEEFIGILFQYMGD